MVQEFNCVQLRTLTAVTFFGRRNEVKVAWRPVTGCRNHYKFLLGAGVKVEERSDEIPPWRGKSCDKPINFIVPVRRSQQLFCIGKVLSISSISRRFILPFCHYIFKSCVTDWVMAYYLFVMNYTKSPEGRRSLLR
jgi:hypothetical protein